MRLVGGSYSDGRLEVLHNNVWGTVCGYYFSAAASDVVCNMLGFKYVFYQLYGFLLFSSIRVGSEHNWLAVHCLSRRDCPLADRIVTNDDNALWKRRKATEITRQKMLHKIWLMHDLLLHAMPVAQFKTCKCAFVYFRIGDKIDNSQYSRALGQIWLDNVQCTGDDENIDECTHSGWGVHDCEHGEDVAISCENTTDGMLHICQL